MSENDGGDAAKGVISPLLANIYLHTLDEWHTCAATSGGEMFVIRYADERCSAFNTGDAERFRQN